MGRVIALQPKDWLAIFDLDGTLFDTTAVNYHAYREALEAYGFPLDYDYFRQHCNGRYYMDFLPQITTRDEATLQAMHLIKQDSYAKHLNRAVPNAHLFRMLRLMRAQYHTAVVTTASRINCMQLLDAFEVTPLFDLIVTREDYQKVKPDPEGFCLAMDRFGITPQNTLIFEDSEPGAEAARRSGAQCLRVTEGFAYGDA
ncbi:MAG TPA: HAD family phosphatase [Candidatus Limiplasma sp.]|nr:HAD family phosphatase [Candidatus Limiplasma sp.]HPS82563.1 HAD family phosphatase [Candidatus Limiplasma sp.]